MPNDEKTVNAVSVKKQPSADGTAVKTRAAVTAAPPAGNGKKICRLEDAAKAAGEFLKKVLNIDCVKVIRVGKAGAFWEVEAEVYEENSFVKSLGLSTKMQDRNYYTVTLDENMETQSYERMGGKPESKGK